MTIHIKTTQSTKQFPDEQLEKIIDQLFNIGSSVSATRNALVFNRRILDGDKVKRKYNGVYLTIWKQ